MRSGPVSRRTVARDTIAGMRPRLISWPFLVWYSLGLAAIGPAFADDRLAEARALARAGQPASAVPIYQELIAENESRPGEGADNLVSLLHELAVQRHTLGEIDKAEVLYQRSVDVARRAHGPRSSLLVPGLRGLAALAAGEGAIDEALSFNLRALRIQEAGNDPRSERARTLAEIGLLSQLHKQDHFAEHFYREVLELGDDAKLKPTEIATIAANLGAMCARQNRYLEAVPFYEQAVEVRERELGREDPGLASVFYDLANLYLRLDRLAEAAPLLERSLKLREKVAPNDLALSDIVSQLAATYYQLGRTSEAELHFGMAKAMLTALCTGRENTEACRSSRSNYRESRDLARTASAEAPPTRAASTEVLATTTASADLPRSSSVDAQAPPTRTPRTEPARSRGVDVQAPPPLEPEPVRVAPKPQPEPEPEATSVAAESDPVLSTPPASVTPASVPGVAESPQSARTGGKIYRSQVAARDGREEAEQLLHELRDAYPQLIGSVPATIVRVDLGERGIWYRIQIGEFAKVSEAKTLCSDLVDRGHDGCWAVEAE